MALERVDYFPHPIVFEQGDLCISLYQQTHRYAPDNRQDPIVFKNLLQEIEAKLNVNFKKEEVQTLLKPLYELRDDKHFWNNTLDGLAILLRPTGGVLYLLPRTVQNVALVSDAMHLTPLLRAFQSADSYHILSLNATEFKLYKGTRYEVEQIQLPEDVATTIEGALGDQITPGALTSRVSRSGSSAIFYGTGSRREEVEKDTERFFRYVDTYVKEKHSKPENLSLLLVALQEHQGKFRKISNNNFLLPEGVSVSPDALDQKSLVTQGWEVLLDYYLARTRAMVDSYHQAQSKFLATGDLSDIGQGVFAKRIRTLLVEDGKILSGRYDERSGKIEYGSPEDPLFANVFDRLILHVLKDKGEVVVLPAERMPTDTGIAAIFRY